MRNKALKGNYQSFIDDALFGYQVSMDEVKHEKLARSAPELLEALKALVNRVDPDRNSSIPLEQYFMEPVKNAREVIAKAEGR